jgi:hypothetical protein
MLTCTPIKKTELEVSGDVKFVSQNMIHICHKIKRKQLFTVKKDLQANGKTDPEACYEQHWRKCQ